jgi:phospholipase A-2-activating protein
MFDEGEYDHIFDVDLGDGFNRKIPFDNGGNPYEAADKFVARE